MYIKTILAIGVGVLFLLPNSFAQKKERVLNYAEQSFPSGQEQFLEPLNIKDNTTARLSQLIFNTLLWIDKEMRCVANLLENLTPEETQSPSITYTLRLRKGLTWHNGTPFTAKDVKFTFDKIMDEKTKTNLQYIRKIVRNVEVIDEYRVRFNLNESMGLIPFFQNIGFIWIIKKIDKPIGLGTYKFENLDKEREKIRLSRNPGYHRGWKDLSQEQHRIEEINMEAIKELRTAIEYLKHKGVDLIPVIRPNYWDEIGRTQGLELHKYNMRSFFYVAFNCDPRKRYNPFVHQEVRQACTLAVDRWRILKTIYGKENVNIRDIMTGPYISEEVSPNHRPLGYDERWNYNSEENISRAKDLLKKAGFPKGFTAELKANIPDEEINKILNNIIEDLKAIGVTINIKPMNFEVWWEEVVKKEDFEMAFGEEKAHAYTDIVEKLFLRNNLMNISSYYNDQVENLIEKIKGSSNTGEIEELKDEIQRIIGNDCPYLFLFRVTLAAGANENLHLNIHPHWFFAFANEWYWKK